MVITTLMGHTVFARTDEKNYTTDNYEEFFNIGYSKIEIVRKRVTALIPNVSAGPGVDVHCLYGTGVDTPFSFYYKDGDFSKTPVATNSDGDGTVHASSLGFCNQWSNTAVTTYSGIDHSGMITDATVIKKVVESGKVGLVQYVFSFLCVVVSTHWYSN